MGQLHCLSCIQDQDGITMKELATLLQVTSPSVTAFADRLVKLGYVRRHHDAHNRKLVRLVITERGKKILKETMAQKKRICQRFLRVISSSDRLNLLTILRRMLATSVSP